MTQATTLQQINLMRSAFHDICAINYTEKTKVAYMKTYKFFILRSPYLPLHTTEDINALFMRFVTELHHENNF